MLKIRLMRIGAKKRPFYRVVIVDERAKRTGAYIESVGTYNPLTEPKDIKLKQDRIDYWIKQGAQMSTGFLRIIGKAPQRPPRKPKKAASAESSGEPKEKKDEAPKEVPVKEDAQKETEQPTEENTQAEAEIPANTSDGGRAEGEDSSEGPARSADGSPVETPVSKEEKPGESENKDEGSA